MKLRRALDFFVQIARNIIGGADRLSRAALISLARFCAKRSPTRIAGTSMAAMTRISSRVRRLIGPSIRARIGRSASVT
jgi:hypothetical protein